MRTIQISIDGELLKKVVRLIQHKKVPRFQLIIKVLEDVLDQVDIEELEQKQEEGYRNHPVKTGEFDTWVSEQAG